MFKKLFQKKEEGVTVCWSHLIRTDSHNSWHGISRSRYPETGRSRL